MEEAQRKLGEPKKAWLLAILSGIPDNTGFSQSIVFNICHSTNSTCPVREVKFTDTQKKDKSQKKSCCRSNWNMRDVITRYI